MARSKMNKEVSIHYTVDTKDMKRAAAEAKRIISDQAAQIKAKNAEMHSSFTKITAAAKAAAVAMVAVFSVRAIANFTKESMKLAASMEGIKKGFQQIATPGLLDDLRKATKGTLSDMQLMKQAVMVSNFDIPLKDLAKLLEFASARAVQTGMDFDYLVNSIVIGIGRKSPKILDNLGISITKIHESLKGVSAEAATVGQMTEAVVGLATEELAKMGGMAETTGVQFQQYTVAVENLKVAWGEYLNQNKTMKTMLQNTTEVLQRLSDPKLNFWQKLMMSGKKYQEWLKSQELSPLEMQIAADKARLFPKGDLPRSASPTSTEDPLMIISGYVQKIKEGAEESRKMAEAWKIIHKEIAGAGVTKGGLTPGMPSVGTGLPGASGLAGAPKMPEIVGEGFEQQIKLVNGLQDAFLGMSSAAMQGGNVLKNMADSMIDSIKRIAAELLAKAALFGILKILFPELFIGMGLTEAGSFGKFVTGGLLGGGKSVASLGMASQNINVGGQFKLKGADAYAMVGRFGNMLYNNT